MNQIVKSPLPERLKKPKKQINIVEYTTPEGITTKYLSRGHVDFDEFRENCKYYFGAFYLQRVFHGFMREIYVKVEKGLNYTTMTQCSSEAKDRLKITVGMP